MYGNNIKDTSVHKQDFEHQSLGFSFTTNCLCLYLQCGFIFLPNTNKSFGLEEPQAAKPIFTEFQPQIHTRKGITLEVEF